MTKRMLSTAQVHMLLRRARCNAPLRAHCSRPYAAVSRCKLCLNSFSTWEASDSVRSQSSRDKGLEFEARVERVMHTMGCDLVRTQASMDGGIDHIGRWRLPDMALDVVTQCKNEQKPVGVQYLREFYGVLGIHASPTTLALFFSASGFSIYAQRFFTRTLHPAILCTINGDDRIVEFLLNDRARAALPRLAVGSCFVDHEHELILTYGDHVLGNGYTVE